VTDSISSLHIIGGKKLGGAERFFVRLVNALARRGEAVEAVTVAGGEIDAAIDPHVPRHHAPLAGVLDLWSRLRIGQIVKQQAPAIVQTYMGRATRLTHLPPKGRSIHVARLGGYYDLKGYRHAHAWIGNTRGICDYLIREGLPSGRVFHIGNFADAAPRHTPEALAELRGKWLIPEDALIVLGLGRLHPNKGFSDLLQAFAQLPSTLRGRPLHLAMVGDGPLRSELKAEAVQLGISGRVTWAGWQYEPSIWYQLADVFACSSRHEPLGNVILEAWANSIPIVTTASEGPVELVTPEQDALLVPLTDPQRLAGSLRQALELDEAARKAMVDAGLAKLEASYSEAAIVAAYIDLYRKLNAGYHG
jgi:glycosyltransferase involved in cell wall biosynthesis